MTTKILTTSEGKLHTLELRKLMNGLFSFIQKRLESQEYDQGFQLDSFLDDSYETHFQKLAKQYRFSKDDLTFLLFAYAWEYHHLTFSSFFKYVDKLDVLVQYQGVFEENNTRFIPTLKTFLELFYPQNKEEMLMYFMSSHHPLFRYGILAYQNKEDKLTAVVHQIVRVSEQYAHHLNGGDPPRLDQGERFPAQLMTPKMLLKHIVLPQKTRTELEALQQWLRVRKKWNELPIIVRKKINKSQLYVFTGAPGTGKSLTASAIGLEYKMPTYRLDLSRVISKYVGEFEKEMEKIFSRLHGQEAILFIDEADAIFSKRDEKLKEAKDKYANQEMAYLLQRVEQFDGVVILATNVTDIRKIFDKAMLRRINSEIEFTFPKAKERYLLWKNATVTPYNLPANVLDNLANNYQVNGANISAVMSKVLIDCIDNGTTEIKEETILEYLRKEYLKRDSMFKACRDDAPPSILMEQRLGRSAVHTGSRM
ncbi:ATP-binding protein [Flammeovirga pacifica]|uniref:AAA+ ATPase domain-containing protein n=1 Tax=Flammeovirga pacifica TaxID=915059 RepID=A0A1S1YUD9_FLAPC|nr:ATP-binding protein [Flammeovirga pacifica]OHX64616.1 hypothetical protein NH26_23890 [Flammeovirga pacifica]